MNPRGGVVGRAGWTARLRVLDDFFAILPSRNTSSRRPFTMTPRGPNVPACFFLALRTLGAYATSTRVGGVAVRTRTSARAHLGRPKMAKIG